MQETWGSLVHFQTSRILSFGSADPVYQRFTQLKKILLTEEDHLKLKKIFFHGRGPSKFKILSTERNVSKQVYFQSKKILRIEEDSANCRRSFQSKKILQTDEDPTNLNFSQSKNILLIDEDTPN